MEMFGLDADNEAMVHKVVAQVLGRFAEQPEIRTAPRVEELAARSPPLVSDLMRHSGCTPSTWHQPASPVTTPAIWPS